MGDITNVLSGGKTQGYQDLGNSLNQAYGNTQNSQYQTQNMLAPYQQYGLQGVQGLQGLLGQSQNQYNTAIGNMNNTLGSQDNGQWMNHYQETPYANYLTGRNLNAMNNAAAGGGILGTGANQQAAADIANNITSSDMQNFFNNMQSQNSMQMANNAQQMGGNQQLMSGYGDLTNVGANAVNQGVNANMNYNNVLANLMNAQGQAHANQDIASQSGKNSALGMITGGFL